MRKGIINQVKLFLKRYKTLVQKCIDQPSQKKRFTLHYRVEIKDFIME